MGAGRARGTAGRNRQVRAKEQPSRPGGCRGLHTRFLCQLSHPRFLCTHSAFPFGLWFENLSGSGWGFGGWPQRNHLAGTACSRTSSIPSPIMPQLFPVKRFFISASTLSNMKENAEREKEGKEEGRTGKEGKEGRKGECHQGPLDMFVAFLSSWTLCPVESTLLCGHRVLS